MIFSYEELREAVEADFGRFCAMGFDAEQILPAVLDEYRYGEGFCEEERLEILRLLAVLYQGRGLPLPEALLKFRRKPCINVLRTEESL